MPFIDRDGNGKITGAYACKQFDGQEQIASNDPGLLAFQNPPPPPLEQLEALITQGQIAMEEAPLPDDIQREIFDLEVFIQNYYRRGLFNLIKAAIEEFTIPDARTDVTTGQRAQVEGLKNQMLAVFA